MNFAKIYLDLIKETFMFKGLKRLSMTKKILCTVLLLPFMLYYATLLLAYGGLILMYKFYNVPYDYIYDFVRTERDSVKHATQAVIYFMAFPMLLMFKMFMSFFVATLTVLHFFITIEGFVATFGGITFSPYLLTPADRSKKECVEHSKRAVNVFLFVGIALLILSLVILPVVNLGYGIFSEAQLFDAFKDEVEYAYDHYVISESQHKFFTKECKEGRINKNNYEFYIEYYGIDLSEDFIEAQVSCAGTKTAITIVNAVIYMAQISFVGAYTLIYGAIMNRKSISVTVREVTAESPKKE